MGDDLNERIAKAQAELDAQNQRGSLSQAGQGMGLGFRMASDFVAAVIVGLVLGWGIDAIFKVSPWGLIVCLMVGFVTGVRNVVRQASAAQTGAGSESNSGAQAPGESGAKPQGETDRENGA